MLRTLITRSAIRPVARAAVAVVITAYAAGAQTADQYAVRVSATALSSPARLSFTWIQDLSATGYDIYRRSPTETSWGTSRASLPGESSGWIDSSVTEGSAYEYRFVKSASGYSGYGYLYGGVDAAPVEYRGTLLLIVDTTYSSSLSPELHRLEADLVGDGWRVIRRDVAPAETVGDIKAHIVQTSQSVPTLNTVFLFGHIARPYSGNINPDGHSDHRGAWPADVYYGELNGAWTDQTVNTTTANSTLNHNVPGDGKFDQSSIPSDAELAVGRVDVAGMQTFTTIIPTVVTLTDLMRRYLDKDHTYRHGVTPMLRRGLIDDNFGAFSGEAFSASAWRDFSAILGSTQVHPRDFFTTLDTASYLFSYGCGGGSNGGAGGVGSTSDFKNRLVNTVFAPLFGSYFGDWAPDGNFLRAPLFSRPSALVSFWSGRPHWHVHHMGLGETIGFGARLSQNAASTQYATNSSARGVHVALMGDPSLRAQVVLPAANLDAAAAGSGRVVLTWQASTDTVVGYHIYRAPSLSDTFVSLSATPITVSSFTDTLAPPGNCVYMVRALKRERTGSGSYFNLSQGVFDSVAVPLSVAHGRAVQFGQARTTLSGRVLRLGLSAPVESSRTIAIVVQSLSGRTVWRSEQHLAPGSRCATLDLSHLKPGTYLVFAGETPMRSTALRVMLW
jgi:hypothetical protein